MEGVKDLAKELFENGIDYVKETRELEALFMGEIFKTPDMGLGGSVNDNLPAAFVDGFFAKTLVRTYLDAFGKKLLGLYHDYGTVPDQTVSLTIHEVSYCDETLANGCGPGYLAYDRGIKSFLDLSFLATWRLDGVGEVHTTYKFQFVTPYNAKIWMEARYGKSATAGDRRPAPA